MKIKASIYTIAVAAIVGGYCSLVPYNSALAQTSDKSPAEKSQKSEKSSGGDASTGAQSTEPEGKGAPTTGGSEKSTGGGASGGAQSSMHGEHKGTPAKGGKAMGSHQMVGTVEDVDTQKGIVDLKTGEGDLKLHFPPKAVANLKKGDQIQVQLSFNTVNKQ